MPYRDLTSYELITMNKALSPIEMDSLFSKYNNNVLYIVEIKDKGELGIKAAYTLIDLIREYNLENYVSVASFNKEIMDFVKEHDDINLPFNFFLSNVFFCEK